MFKKEKIGSVVAVSIGGIVIVVNIMEKKAKKTAYTAENIEAIQTRKIGFYEKYIKRLMDILCASAAIICFSPLYIGLAILVRIKLGSPVLFTQIGRAHV